MLRWRMKNTSLGLRRGLPRGTHGAKRTGHRPDLKGANLREATPHNADLCEADLSRANMCETYLAGALLIRANLSGACLERAYLSGANLMEADLIIHLI